MNAAENNEALITSMAEPLNLLLGMAGIPMDCRDILRDVWLDFQPTFGLLIASTSGADDEFAYYTGGNQQ